MQISIDDHVIHNQIIGPLVMNFDQLARWRGRERLSYKIKMSKVEFFNHITDFFEKFRQEEIEDEEEDFEGVEELLEFKDSGYPKLQDLLDNVSYSQLLGKLILFNKYEILHLVSQWEARTQGISYAIVTMDKVEIQEEDIIFAGIAFQNKVPAQ